MKLRNKKTGEIVEATDFNIISDYNSLAELTEDWEDVPEDSIDDIGLSIYSIKTVEILYQTKEQAEKAVEKLKAWKRLKDCGFKFVGWKRDERYSGDYHIEAEDFDKCDDKDLELLFGGEE